MSGMNFQKSKCVVIISLLFLIVQNVALGQTDSTKVKPVNSLKDGAWALQFQIDKYFYLSDFQGSTISYKKHTSDRSAIRVGLTIGLSIGDEERETIRSSGTSVTSNIDEVDHNSQSIRLRMQKLWYGQPKKKLTVYYGFGPTVAFTRFENKTVSSFDSGSERLRSNRFRTWTVGVTMVLGGEWFATDKISFLAEYGSDLVYLWRKSSSIVNENGAGPPRITERTSVSKQGSFRSIPVKFGISLYF